MKDRQQKERRSRKDESFFKGGRYGKDKSRSDKSRRDESRKNDTGKRQFDKKGKNMARNMIPNLASDIDADADIFRDVDPTEDLIVYGKNAVWETLQSGVEVNKLLVIKDSKDHTIQKIIDFCKEKKCPIRFADKESIDRVESGVHQGVVLYTAPYRYVEIEDILTIAEERGEAPFVIILDGITDPHNLGAIMRTAEAAGAHGIVIPKRGSAVITSTVVKISSGAAEHIAVARVGNLVSAMKTLKEKGLWIVGTAPEAREHYTDYDYKGSLGIVIGSEGKGMSRLVEENCDSVLRIDMYGKTSSLNASVAAGVLIFEALRQRRNVK